MTALLAETDIVNVIYSYGELTRKYGLPEL